MLTYFPSLFPDELLYSWFARYHDHSGNVSSKQTMQELFGKISSVAVVDFPNNVKSFYNNIEQFNPPNIKSIIKNHTMYNYYTVFQSEEMRKRAIDYIKNGGKPGAIHMFLGIAASTIKDWQYLRFCDSCVKQDREQYGEAYWHMNHQFPKVFYCHLHQELLYNSNIKLRNPHKHEFISAEKANLIPPNIFSLYSSKTEHHLKKLSKESLYLLSLEPVDDICKIYKYLMQINGYANHLGKVHQKYFVEKFKSYYGEELLTLIDCNFDECSDTSWIRSIVRKHRKAFHPIQHLLVLNFLGVSVKNLKSLDGKIYKPFGEGPYYCLNPAADHYKKRVINDVVITTCSKTRKPVGTFECECGFIYSRRGPDNSESDNYRLGRIKEFGHIWLKKLKHLVANQICFFEIAKILKCDYKTVQKYANLYFENTRNDCLITKRDLQKKCDEWLAILKENIYSNISELRKIRPDLYMWHYRNNKDWLFQNGPSKEKFKKVLSTVDWEKRDKQVLMQVRKIIEDLFSREKPVYVNKTKVLSLINLNFKTEKVLHKLPLSKAYLEINIETRTDFQKRRIIWAFNNIVESGESITFSKVKRKAGIKGKFDDLIIKTLKEVNLDDKYWIFSGSI